MLFWMPLRLTAGSVQSWLWLIGMADQSMGCRRATPTQANHTM
ncbi:hypothetical protein [Marivivens marinus]